MTEVVEIGKARVEMAVRRAYRNWRSHFKEDFGPGTHLYDISTKTIVSLGLGKEKSTFYLFDLIMNLENLGSGFEFSEIDPKDKMLVLDQYLFLLDRTRFEYMKRLGWLENYPGEDIPLVDLILDFNHLAPRLQANTPILSRGHDAYDRFQSMNVFEREELVRKLIPKALKHMEDQSTTS
ncbi:MAG: hypothetical protein JW836_10555 [Deltaproteobacteria bacterium]|nr:hypothetical protein [Deltaproteobacteria bacterium]